MADDEEPQKKSHRERVTSNFVPIGDLPIGKNSYQSFVDRRIKALRLLKEEFEAIKPLIPKENNGQPIVLSEIDAMTKESCELTSEQYITMINKGFDSALALLEKWDSACKAPCTEENIDAFMGIATQYYSSDGYSITQSSEGEFTLQEPGVKKLADMMGKLLKDSVILDESICVDQAEDSVTKIKNFIEQVNTGYVHNRICLLASRMNPIRVDEKGDGTRSP